MAVNKVVKSNGDTIIDLTQDTVTSSEHIMSGYVGHLASGAQVTGTGVGGVQSDWAQNDSTALDYVKNRVCYSEDPVYMTLFQYTGTVSSETRIIGDWQTQTPLPDPTDNPYTFTFNNDTYTGTLFYNGSYGIVAGNFYIINSEADDTGEPFCVTFGSNDGLSGFWNVFLAEAYTGTVALEFKFGTIAVHTLDDKYLNGSLIKSGTGANSVLLNGDDVHASLSADGDYSVAQGTYTSAEGYASHAEGEETVSSGYQSHAEGYGTIANHKSQHVSGEYNVADPSQNESYQRGSYVEIVGNGNYFTRSNARTLDWNGNEVLAGKLTVGAAPTANMDVATKQYVDTAVAGSGGSSASNNPTLETEWVDVYSDWAAGYYYDPDNNYAYTQIPSTETTWEVTETYTSTSCTPYSNLIPVKAGEEWRYNNMPVYFDSKAAIVPSIVIFDSNKAEIDEHTRTFQDEWTEFTIPSGGVWMAVLYANSQAYYLQKKVAKRLDKDELLDTIKADYRAYTLTAAPIPNTLTKAYICLGTDDLRGWETKNLHTLFTTNNIPYYMATIPGNIKACVTNDPYKTNLDYMRLCVAAGGEIICHSGPVITEQNKNDFDFMHQYFAKGKEEIESYGFKVRGIFKAGGEDAIYGEPDPVIDAWAMHYYDYGDDFTTAFPYLNSRTMLEDWEDYSALTSAIQNAVQNHTPFIGVVHYYNQSVETAISTILSALQGYTEGTDYEFVTPGQLYDIMMPTARPTGGGGGTAITYSISMANNVITLTGSNGSTSSVILPVYTGGVT